MMVPYKTLLGVAVIVLSLVIAGTLWRSALSDSTSETHTLKMDLKVGTYAGINIDTDALHFGTVPKGKVGSLAREVVVENNDNVRRNVFISASGELAPYVGLSEDEFTLDPFANKTVEVTLIVPPGLDSGSYNGTLTITLKRP